MPRKMVDKEDDDWMEGRMWHRGYRRGWWGLCFGLFILVIGVSWFGHDVGWWNFSLPWLPLAVVLIGAGMVLKWASRRWG